MKVGDEVMTVPQLWHHAENVGNRLGVVLSMRGHILVHLYEYHDNPVKCFRNEIELVEEVDEDDDNRSLLLSLFDGV